MRTGLVTDGSIGTAGRNILDGPARKDVDFSVMKLFTMPWGEQHRLQFRAEFFNFPNHPNFGFAGSDVSNQATFGRIRSGGAGREIQFALRYMF